MKCPLAAAACIIRQGDLDKVTDDCLKEECAWWDKDNARCGLMTLASYLGFISIHLEQIKEKMPHAGQFTK